MMEFKYNIIDLIQSIKARPCLWDKELESYKDRLERRKAWEEIFSSLEEGYESMSFEDKKTIDIKLTDTKEEGEREELKEEQDGELILNKWTNTRDTFLRTLRSKNGKPKKKYILHEYLTFLLKNKPTGYEYIEYENAEENSGVKEESEEGTSHSTRKKKRIDYSEERPKKRSKEKVKSDSDYETYDTGRDSTPVDFVEVNTELDPRVMNEDEAFFASLLPTVVKYNEDQRLEFRIEVLSVMKKIKDKVGCSVD